MQIQALGLPPPSSFLDYAEKRNNMAPGQPISAPSFMHWLGVGPSDSGEVVTPATATAISTVNSCVRLLTSALSSCPVLVWSVAADGKKSRAISHPLFRLLNQRPCPDCSSQTFFTSLMSSVLLHGNAYAEITADGTGQTNGLWFIEPSCVQPFRQPDNSLAYRVTQGSNVRVLVPKQILHFVGDFSLDGVTGASVISQVPNLFGSATAMDKFQARFYRNNGTPAGILKTDQKLPAELKHKMRADWEAMQTGNNQHRVAVMDQDLVFQPLATPQADAQMVETKKLIRSEICGLFHLAPWQIGSEERTSSEVFSGQQLTFLVEVLRPWLLKFSNELNYKLTNNRTDLVIDFDVSDRLRLDQKAQLDSISVGRYAGIITSNEGREIMGRDPDPNPWANDLWRPVNMVPASVPVYEQGSPVTGGSNEKTV